MVSPLNGYALKSIPKKSAVTFRALLFGIKTVSGKAGTIFWLPGLTPNTTYFPSGPDVADAAPTWTVIPPLGFPEIVPRTENGAEDSKAPTSQAEPKGRARPR